MLKISERIGSRGIATMSALTWNHGVVNTCWAVATKLTSDALVEALGLDVHQVSFVEKVHNVEAHALTHLSWINCSSSCPVDSSNLSTKVSMRTTIVSSTANCCLVELDVGAKTGCFLDRVVGLVHCTVHALVNTLLLAVVRDVLKLKTIGPHSRTVGLFDHKTSAMFGLLFAGVLGEVEARSITKSFCLSSLRILGVRSNAPWCAIWCADSRLELRLSFSKHGLMRKAIDVPTIP